MPNPEWDNYSAAALMGACCTAGLLPDFLIERYATQGQMIAPFCGGDRGPGKISRGLTSYGYDLTLADEVWLVGASGAEEGPAEFEVMDPKARRPLRHKKLFPTETDAGRWVLLPPLAFALGHSVETLKMPPDVSAVAHGKSTYARSGLIVAVTPIEAGWEGQVTVELFNCCRSRVKVYLGEGVCQLQFFRGVAPCRLDYAAKGGFYQGQSGVQQALCRPKE